MGWLQQTVVPVRSSGSRKECAEAVAELSYGWHRGVRFEIAAELGQPDVCPVGADAVLQEFQADVGGIEGAGRPLGEAGQPGIPSRQHARCSRESVREASPVRVVDAR